MERIINRWIRNKSNMKPSWWSWTSPLSARGSWRVDRAPSVFLAVGVTTWAERSEDDEDEEEEAEVQHVPSVLLCVQFKHLDRGRRLPNPPPPPLLSLCVVQLPSCDGSYKVLSAGCRCLLIGGKSGTTVMWSPSTLLSTPRCGVSDPHLQSAEMREKRGRLGGKLARQLEAVR